MRKKRIAAVVALGLALTAVRVTPSFGRLAEAVRAFQRSFNGLQSANASLNPIERVVFSLILASAKSSQAPAAPVPPKS
jgi:hypothetical protein